MSEITLEKVEQIKERTGLSYKEAKEALEKSEGDVLEALIYIENKKIEEKKERFNFNIEDKYETIDELKKWLVDIIKKGNISRVKIKKEDKVLVDVPVNAGIAAGAIAIILPPILAVGVITAIATKITIEITKVDGSVEVVNKLVKKTADEVKDKTSNFAESIRTKISEMKNGVISNKEESEVIDDTVYTYTVNFEDVDSNSCEEKQEDKKEKDIEEKESSENNNK